MKQYKYTKDSIKQCFLASYADIAIKDSLLFFVNILTDRQIMVVGKNSLLVNLVLRLENGVSEEELINLLSAIGEPSLIELLFREGMIE